MTKLGKINSMEDNICLNDMKVLKLCAPSSHFLLTVISNGKKSDNYYLCNIDKEGEGSLRVCALVRVIV